MFGVMFEECSKCSENVRSNVRNVRCNVRRMFEMFDVMFEECSKCSNNIPFARHYGSFQDYGCISNHSIAVGHGTENQEIFLQTQKK